MRSTSSTSGDPGISGWNRIHPTAQVRDTDAVLARWGSGQHKAQESLALPDVSGTFGHLQAGLLRLTAKGTGSWVLHLRGSEFGIGPVGRRERRGDVLRPSRRTLNQAAELALREGPESPPGSQIASEGKVITVAQWMIQKGLVRG